MRTNEEYKNLEAERDALAARVAEMREALNTYGIGAMTAIRNSVLNGTRMRNDDHGWNTKDVVGAMEFAIEKTKAALASPDDSAAILAKHDAAIWREAAKVCERISDEYREREGHRYPELKTDAEAGASDCEAALRARAAELGKEQ